MSAALILGAAQIGASLLGSSSRRREEKRQERFQKKLARKNKHLTNRQTRRNIRQVQKRTRQEHIALSQQVTSVEDQARRALAASQAQGSESGTSGKSVAALINDIERQKLKSQQSLIRTQAFRDDNATQGIKDLFDRQRVADLNHTVDPIQLPGFLSEIGSALGAGLTAYLGAGGTFGSSKEKVGRG